jgi:hypothetical protein
MSKLLPVFPHSAQRGPIHGVVLYRAIMICGKVSINTRAGSRDPALVTILVGKYLLTKLSPDTHHADYPGTKEPSRARDGDNAGGWARDNKISEVVIGINP